MSKFKKAGIWYLITSLVFVAGTAFCDIHPGAGTTGAQFLKFGPGARPSAMGDAYCTVEGDAFALLWNSASIANIEKGSFSFMHSFWMENVFIDYAICAVPLQIGNFSANFGIFFGYLNAGVIDRIDNTGTVLSGGFTPYDIILGASFAKKIFGNLGVGGTVKGIYSDIAGISSASCAFDAGFTYGLLQDSLKVGASVQNLGFPMKFSSQQDSLPLTIRVGASYKLKSLLVSLDSVIPNDGNLTLHFGAEYGIKIMYGIDGLLRIGYNGKNALTGGLAGFSLGGGIQGNVYTIDYAWVPYGIVGSTHRLSMGLKF